MAVERADIVNLSDVQLNQVKAGSRFYVGVHDVDRTLGLTQLGAMLHVVPAGKTAWPYHRHHGKDELYLILSGSGCRSRRVIASARRQAARRTRSSIRAMASSATSRSPAIAGPM
jgi:hypothetical protein